MGKPWLRAVKAIHDYSTDKITITYDGNSDTIPNSAAHPDDKIHSVITPTKEDNTPVPETDPIEQLDHEWARIHQIRASASPWRETRWSQYLDVDILDDDEDTEDDNYNYEGLSDLYLIKGKPLSAKERRAKDAEELCQLRETEGEVSLLAAISNADAIREQERIAQRKRKRNMKKKPCTTTQAPTDPNLDSIYLLEESETRIRHLCSKLEYLRVINEPEPQRSQYSRDPYSPCNRTDDFDVGIHKLGDIRHVPFAIDRGSNVSCRVTDPFSEERINEILSKVEIGTDLMDEQRDKVTALITEFTDIFALSMSEVLVVDWHQHHLDVDPDTKLPKRMSQRPITENQKEWYYKMLDEIEASSVIQKVPGEFIKCLSSTNLAPKEAGKTGTTRIEVL